MTKTPAASKNTTKATGADVASPAPIAAEAQITAPAPRLTKTAMLRASLAEPGGASTASLMVLTGWQAHTLRAALSGLHKTGLTIIRRQEDGETFYSIVADAAETAEGGAASLAVETAEEGDAALAAVNQLVEALVDDIAQTPSAPLPTEQFASGDQP